MDGQKGGRGWVDEIDGIDRIDGVDGIDGIDGWMDGWVGGLVDECGQEVRMSRWGTDGRTNELNKRRRMPNECFRVSCLPHLPALSTTTTLKSDHFPNAAPL